MKRLSDDVIDFVHQYVRLPEGRAVGEPMILMEWQRSWLRAVFDNPVGTRRAILSVGRKNSKSSLVAALLLAYLVGPLATKNSQIYSAALSREQASLIFQLMSKMVRMHADLAEHVVIRDSSREMLCTLTGVRFRALSAESATAMGTSPVAFVFDEAGQVVGPHCPLFDALHSGQGAHAAPIEFVISTQASSDSDFFSMMLDDALTGADPHTVVSLYAAPADADLMDEEAWRAANPSIGTILSLDYMRGLAEEASRLPSREPQFRNLNLNTRTEARAPFISRSLWVKNDAAPKQYAGQKLWAGLDLSSTNDLTALVLAWKDEEIWQIQPYFWTPRDGLAERARRDHAAYQEWVRDGHLLTTPGPTVDYDFVASKLMELVAEADVQKIAFDRWRIETFKSSMVRMNAPEGLLERLHPFGQGYQSMSPAIEALERELLNGRMAHGAHPVLSMCAANATIASDPAGNRKLDKLRSTGRIDGLQALAMAIGAAMADGAGEREPEYQCFFV